MDLEFNIESKKENSNSKEKENKLITDYSKFFSLRNTTPVQVTPIELKSFVVSKDYYQFGAGVPSHLFFPIKGLKFQFQYVDETIEIEEDNLGTLQQYSQLPGFPKLIEWLRELQKRYHGLDSYDTEGKEWDILLTTGSQQGLDVMFKVFLDRNDSLLTERYSYGGMFALSQPFGVNTIGIEMDDRGVIPDQLQYVLKNWCTLHRDKKFPKALYVIPHGQNPTGIIYDLERKREIYNICREWDLLIIEDDPHFFLQFENPMNEKGHRILEKSFLKIDTDDRVVRLDTFSKFLSSGIRMGIITCSKKLMPIFNLEVTCAIFHPSGLTQAMLEALFLRWGYEGFENHVKRVQDILIQKRKDAIENIEKHLKGLVTYRVPNSGLYLWLKLNNVDCSLTFIRDIVFPRNVLFGLGISHSPDRNVKSPYIRVTFSYLEKEDGDVAFKILGDCLRSLNGNNNIDQDKKTVSVNDKSSSSKPHQPLILQLQFHQQIR
ncbi:hypothetical protein DICPUDRAFT_153380 [Dictyostelium purpureum]|uniref:Aminotransferase class I/classII large domain-containing protein n=1 Tax=Dictyostelium purpureum TaxID=5786 RepID=F0ZNR6_DICPU|nr:uncharacterized protein DICPUDRAFT_153380 [Dictyostelium purpureum]EGC34422.1 hypothetical protein DICPUDRAFT_153380 [Dictyostelium purpureum]|eukprot:XP_003289051.1 hypothetical protein DICPUDRAFT_153380 [Dictyostelium purpureum]